MAIKIYEKFAPRANPADGDYPYGSIKNESVPGAKDGTPLDAVWANDYAGFDAALFAEAGIVPSGAADTAIASQRLASLHSVFDTYSTIVELASGKFQVGKRVSVTDRAEGIFLISSGGTPNGYDILDAGNGNTAVLQVVGGIVAVDWFGAKSSNSAALNALHIQAAINYVVSNSLGALDFISGVYSSDQLSVVGGNGESFIFRGPSKYGWSVSLRLNSNIGIYVDGIAYIEFENIFVTTTDYGGAANAFPLSKTLIKTKSANIRARHSRFEYAGIILEQEGGFESFYNSFDDCRIRSFGKLVKTNVLYNMDFINCRIARFNRIIDMASGPGPVNFIGGSVEQWCDHAIYNVQTVAGMSVNVSGTYIENYPGAIAGGSFSAATFTAPSFVFNPAVINVSGCTVYLAGIRRFVFPSQKLSISSMGNGFILLTDASTGLSETEFVYPSSAGTTDNFIGSDHLLKAVETAVTDPSIYLYSAKYFDSTIDTHNGIGFDILTNKVFSPKLAWTTITPENGHISSVDASAGRPVQYQFRDGKLKLRGVLNSASATAETFETLTQLIAPSVSQYRQAIATSAVNSPFIIRLLAPVSGNATLRVEGYSATGNSIITLDGIEFIAK